MGEEGQGAQIDQFGLWTGAGTINLVQRIVTGIAGFWLKAKHIRPVLILQGVSMVDEVIDKMEKLGFQLR
eukprot:12356034-Ditylum_brightwellii.AAC.1